MINPLRKFRRIWSPHSIYFGWPSFRKSAPSSLFEVLKLTSFKISMISSFLRWRATRSFLRMSLLVIVFIFIVKLFFNRQIYGTQVKVYFTKLNLCLTHSASCKIQRWITYEISKKTTEKNNAEKKSDDTIKKPAEKKSEKKSEK